MLRLPFNKKSHKVFTDTMAYNLKRMLNHDKLPASRIIGRSRDDTGT